MTEIELAEGCKRGENRARRALYESYSGAMFGLCLRYAGNREDAEDCLQDGFLRLFEVIGKFQYRGPGSLDAWVKRVFTNLCLDRINKKKRSAEEDVENVPDVPDDDGDDSGLLDLPAEKIVELMGLLPEGFRTVLNLYLVEGWSHREIAAKLGISESTSASQYLRAKKRFRKILEDYLNNQEITDSHE